MSWSCLPEELWKLILTHVPLAERLGSCSRVSQKLCRAAAAVTEQLQVQLRHSEQRSEGLRRWLHPNGHYVSMLQLEGLSGDLAQLPCPKLQQLCVRDGAVLLGPSSNQPGILRSCSGLTKFERVGRILDVCQSLAALSAVPALQHLRLELSDIRLSAFRLSGKYISMPGSILQVLTQLTFLRLGFGILIDAEALQHISALQHLQVLDLYQPRAPLSPSSTPGLAQLTALTSFRLKAAKVDVAVLQPHRNLQRLVLESCTLSGGTSAATTLLYVIGQQSQLQQLSLVEVQCEWPPAPAAYTALTASSRLQRLDWTAEGLPAGILQAMFCPEQQLPELTSLTIGNLDAGLHEGSSSAHADIIRLAGCCPGLCSLETDLQPDVQLEALSQLTGLTGLTVYGMTEASVISLQCLSNLKRLELDAGPAFSPEALLQLTALRGLTNLKVDADGDDADGDDNINISLTSINQDPDVWLQLLEHCAGINSCQQGIVRGLGLQLAQQQHRIQELQQQNTLLQQQAADSASTADELRRRLAALEKQVAQLMQAPDKLQHGGCHP